MKNLLVTLLSILILLGCSSEEPISETVEKTITTTITINESNITGPSPIIPSLPSSYNRSNFQIAIPFNLTPTFNQSLKSVVVNNIEFDVTKYECVENSLFGSINFNTKKGFFSVLSIEENSVANGVYYNHESSAFVADKLSSDLLERKETIVYLQGTISNDAIPFEIRLTFSLNITLELIKI